MKPALSEDSIRLIEGRPRPPEPVVREKKIVSPVDPSLYAKVTQNQRRNRAKK